MNRVLGRRRRQDEGVSVNDRQVRRRPAAAPASPTSLLGRRRRPADDDIPVRPRSNIPERFRNAAVPVQPPAVIARRAADRDRMDNGGAISIADAADKFDDDDDIETDRRMKDLRWIKRLSGGREMMPIRNALLDFASVGDNARAFYDKLVEYFSNVRPNTAQTYRTLGPRAYKVRRLNECQVRAWLYYIDNLNYQRADGNDATNLQEAFLRIYRLRNQDVANMIRNFRNPLVGFN